MMQRLTCATGLTVLLWLVLGNASAQPLPQGQPDSLGFSEERLQRLTDHLQRAVDDGIMVGGEALIARRGEIAYRQTFGMRDREADMPATTDTLYRIYSMTKPVTSVAMMMLYEEGRFQLNDPLAQYLPEFAGLKVLAAQADNGDATLREPARAPTIRDLLRHTAGLTYGVFGNTPVDKAYRETELLQSPDLETFTRRLASLPLLYDPGERWHYSVAVDLQGRLVEVLSGSAFDTFLRERIFEPLGMHDTAFVLSSTQASRLAQLYSPEGTEISWNDPWKLSRSQTLEVADPRLSEAFIEGGYFASGGGGLVSSTSDYLRFSQMLLNGGELDGTRLLSPRTVEHMRRNHVAGLDTEGLTSAGGFGLGVAVTLDPGISGEIGSPGSYGWGGAAGTRFWIDPEEEIIAIFMTQSVPHQTQLGDQFRTLVYQALID
ncbi:serine hydrolase domain-containing protein [Chromatocurvus halotolerans]|uniref:CubicO group peptidase (Beta-lactamase class C family) n=1 Tax=Chromatocurvus halotolerans TaxID=1132028 RepID=A0A4V2SC73_9GAMM|nr:serine hydrolase domain-containing protein [Chromatocurvus halotolerans]TCO78290.1 CubicO group peptidase (beta-lactamase class C family) [Chromatocurvus halotolerans]